MRHLVVITLLLSASTALGQATKVGPGVQVVPRAAAPGKDAANSAYWTNSADANKPYYTTPAGVSTALVTAGIADTLQQTYANGTVAADQTMSIAAVDGGPLVCKANAAATGTLFQTQTSAAAALVTLTDNSTNTLRSAMADGAAAISMRVDTATAWANATAKIASLATNAVEKFSVYAASGLIESSWDRAIGTAQTTGLQLANTTAAAAGAQQYGPMMVSEGRGWKTNATAASQNVALGWQTRPVEGTTNPDVDMVLWRSINGGSFAEMLAIRYNLSNDLVRIISPATFIDVFNSNSSGIRMLSTTLTLFGNGSAITDIVPQGMRPQGDLLYINGDATHRWTETHTRHLSGGQVAVPTCIAGTGAGTSGGPTCSALAGSTDLAGTLEVTTATTPAGAGATVATVTFNTAYTSAPRCIFSAADSDSATALLVAAIFIDQTAGSATTFVVKNQSAVGLTGATAYQWNYNCIQ